MSTLREGWSLDRLAQELVSEETRPRCDTWRTRRGHFPLKAPFRAVEPLPRTTSPVAFSCGRAATTGNKPEEKGVLVGHPQSGPLHLPPANQVNYQVNSKTPELKLSSFSLTVGSKPITDSAPSKIPT